MVENLDVRDKAKVAGIKLWEIAEELPLSDANFSRWLRRELPESTKERIFEIIEQLATKKKREG